MTIYTSTVRENEKNTHYPNPCRVDSLSDLLNAVKNDHVAASFYKGNRAKENYISADCLIFDLDNTHSDDPEEWQGLDHVREEFPNVRGYAVRSRNYMKPKQKKNKDTGEVTYSAPREKYHLYFPLSGKIEAVQFVELVRKAVSVFPFLDTASIDLAHFFYGVEDPRGDDLDGDLVLDEFLNTIPEDQPERMLQEVSEMVSAGKFSQESFSKLQKLFGVKASQEAPAELVQLPDGLDWIKHAEQKKSLHWFDEWASKHGVSTGLRYLVNTARHAEAIAICVTCPWSDSHSSDGAENESVVIIDLDGKLNYLCRHDHCYGRSWKEYREAVENASGKADVIATTKDGKIVPVEKKKAPVPKLRYVSAAELGTAVLPEIHYPVEGLIPEGETVIAAPPKSGKSWWVLDAGLSVSQGKPFLGFKTNKCDVVYFALEDGDKFEQERLNKICRLEDLPKNFHYVFSDVVPLDEGFIDQLEDTRAAFPALGLVIIDTLRFVACKQKKNESAYASDYRTGQMLKAWGDKYGIAILAVTHTTKLIHPSDALANVTGTNGVTGAADAVIVIAKEKRTATSAVLAVDGRRVRQAEHDVKINWDRCQWEYVGISDADNREQQQRLREIEELRASSAYQAALKIADAHVDGWKGTARKLIDDAADLGIFVIESPKEVGGMLTNNKAIFAMDGVRVEKIDNGTGSNRYKLSMWTVQE